MRAHQRAQVPVRQHGCACGGTCSSCAQPHKETTPVARAPALQNHHFADVSVTPRQRAVNIPAASASDADAIINEPRGPGRPPVAPAAPAAPAAPSAGSCAPFSMRKVVAGTFESGLGLDDYYPDLASSNIWGSANTAGPFDTGSRAGSSVQLIGTFPSPCRPDLFSLAQTVTFTRAVINGVNDPQVGVTRDDVAESGRDASTAPFRRDWLGGGYNVSMADPPSISYAAGSNIELDRSFTTSLIGPDGRMSVDWSTSIRIVNGAVTQNTIT